MAHFRRSVESFSPTRTLKIIGSEYVEDHTVYIIEVSVGLYKWYVRHRYSDFHALHEKLIQHFPTLDWSLLPKKKLFGTQTEQFIKKRQTELENYLQLLIQDITHIPPVLMKFLDFHKYEVHGITETLAETLYENGDAIIQSEKLYHMSPLQIHSVCTRLALPEPTCDSGDFRKDIGHLLDFVTRLKHLQIDGSTLPVGRSNINMNDLMFDLHCFKSLATLQVSGCNMDKISEVEHLKKSLTYVGASHSLSCLKEMLLIGVGRGQLTMCDENTATLLVQPWSSVRRANFSHNRIPQIDESAKLLPHVELLDLSHNRLEAIHNLEHLSCLQRLILAHNLIRFIPSLHTKLGNITALDLSHNKLDSLEGLAKLYSLEFLDVSHNDITQILEVRYVGSLPCLDCLDLSGNPVTASLDYRTTVLEMFGDRAKEITFDGAKPTAQEIDMVAVRCALNKSREAKRATRKPGRKVAVNEPTIVDAEQLDTSGTPSSATSRSVFPYPSTTPCSVTPPSSETLLRDGANASPGGVVGDGSATSDAAQLRQKISQLQATAGTCWLRQLNQLLEENQVASSDRTHPDPQVSQSSSSASAKDRPDKNMNSQEVTRFPLGHLERRLKRTPGEDDLAKGTESETGRKLKRSQNFMLPETLPNSSDAGFCAHLQTLIPQRGKSSESDEGTELPIHIMWCTAVLSRVKFETEFPGCIYVTTENIHVFSVRMLAGDTGIPRLSRTLKLPLGKISRITIGHEGLYVLVEWASTEPRAHGVVAFLTFSAGKADAFINSIKLAHRRSIPELDDYEDPHVVSSNGVEATLKQALNVYEQYSDPERIRVILYLLVMVEGPSTESVKTSSLVITSNYIYLVKQDYCNTPVPSYASSLPVDPVFQVVSIFPVTSRIVTIQMYDIDTIESSNNHSLLSTFSKPSLVSASSVGFIGYGVRVSFHLGEYGIQVLDVRMPTSNLRERFLSTLVHLHSDISDALGNSPFLKPRAAGGVSLRDTDNASCDSYGSQRSSSRVKGKGGKRKQNVSSKLPTQSGEGEVALNPNLLLSATVPEGNTDIRSTSVSGVVQCVSNQKGPTYTEGTTALQTSPQHKGAKIPSIPNQSGADLSGNAAVHENTSAFRDTSSSPAPDPKSSNPTDFGASISSLTEADVSIAGPSSEQNTPARVAEFKTNSPASSQEDRFTELSRSLRSRTSDSDLMGISADPSLPDATFKPAMSNSSPKCNIEEWHDSNETHHDTVEATSSTNPFETDSRELDAVQISGNQNNRDKALHSSSQSTRSSVRSLSPSSLDSSQEDVLKHSPDEVGSLDHEEGAVLRTEIVSESDIAVVRLSVGNTALTDTTDFTSNDPTVPPSSPKTRPSEFDRCSQITDTKPDWSRAGRTVPVSLPFQLGYPSNELLDHLSECFDTVPLFPTVSAQFEAFMSMSGLELVNYFHQNIAIISKENEELRHVLWTLVVPYTDPTVEIPSCVLLSTKAIYFVSDYCGQNMMSSASGLRAHKRYSSDSTSIFTGTVNEQDRLQQTSCHLSCGILSNSSFTERKRVLRSYATIFLRDLKQVNIGIFCQTMRLTGPDERTVLACVTHSCQTTEAFLNQLRTILLQFYPLPSPDVATSQELEQDFYKMFSKPRSLEAKQASDARLLYPADDCVSDITYLICRQLKGRKADFRALRLLSYLLCLQVESSMTADVPFNLLYSKPRTLLLTEDHLVLAVEDHVSYPLPDFARMPPARPQMEIIEVRYLEFLQRITLHSEDVHVVILIFSDETGEVIVDTSVEHFSADKGVHAAPEPVQEVSWVLLIQNSRSRDKLIKLISQQWEELHRGKQLTINTLP